MRRTLTLLSVFALLLGALTLPAMASSNGKTATFTGGGFTNGMLEDLECDPPDFGVVGEPDWDWEAEGYLLWILAAHGRATTATLQGPFDDVPMVKTGPAAPSAFQAITPYYELDDLLAGDGVTATHNGRSNGQLVVSHGCPGEVPASILFEKVYDTEPLEGEAAEFALRDDPFTEIPLYDVDGRNIYCLDVEPNTAGDDYWVTETEAPTGFEDVEDFPVTAAAGTCEDRLDDLPETIFPTITNESGPVDVTITKFKLDEDGETDTGLPGFGFEIYDNNAPSEEAGGMFGTLVTDANGEILLPEGLEVGGSYTVCEVSTPNPGYWTPADCQYINPTLEDVEDGIELEFYNAPKADLLIGFTDVTFYTSMTVVCVDADDNEVINETWSSTDQVTAPALDLGDYSCDISIGNGGFTPPPADE